MIRRTRLSAVLTVLLAAALLAFVGPVAAQATGDTGVTVDGEGDVDVEQAGSIDIAIEPAELETAPGDVTTYEVVVYGATNGIEGYDNIEVVIEDPSVGQFVDFFETAQDNEGDQGLFTKTEIRDGNGNTASEGPVFWMEAGLGNKTFDGADRIVVAEVDIEALGQRGDSTNVTISEQPGGFTPVIQNQDEDIQFADELRPSTATLTNFAVDILGTNTPVAGDDLQVEFEVENIANVTETQEVTLTTDPATGSSSTTVTLGGGASTVETLSVPTQTGEAGEYTVTVASDNSADSANATVLAEPGFAVELLDTTEPVEGNDLEVQFQVENVDTVADTQSVTLTTNPDIGSSSTDVTLGGGNTTIETLSVPTQVGDDGQYTATVASNVDSDSATTSVLAQAEFDLNITAVDEGVVEGDTLDVNYTIENVGEVQGTQDIAFTVDGAPEETATNVTVPGGATILRSFTYDTAAGDAPSVDVAVASEDDTDSQTVPVDEPPFFAVNITAVDAAVTEGETVTVDYEVTNTGDTEGTQSLSFTVDGTEEATVPSVSLAPGESFGGQFTYETVDGDAPEIAVAVASEDDTATATVTVDEPAFFDVALTNVDGKVTQGETVTADYEVTNTGDIEGTQNVTFAVDGTTEDTETDLTLAAGGTFTGQFTYATGPGDAPEVTVSVATENDTDSQAVTVDEPPFFDAAIAFIDKEVTAGNPLTVAYTVTNTGDVEGTQELTLEINGTTEVTETQTLGASETASGQFVYDTSADDIPAAAVALSSENTTDTDTVPVNEPSFFAVTLTGVDSEVTEGETVTVDYEIENTGGTEGTQDIVFAVNGTSEGTETDLTLGGGETSTGQFTYETGTGDAPAVDVAVASENDTATETVTVNEPPFFAVTLTGVGSEATEGETVTVDYEVTNTGGVADTQDISFTVDGSQEATDPALTLTAGETATGQFSYDTVEGDAPEIAVAVASENDTATETVAVDEPAFFAVTLTGVDSEVTEGETVTVDYEVTNTGDIEATQNISFEVDGTTEDTESGVTLAGNATFAGQFTYTTGSGDAPSVAVVVASEDDSEMATVTVEEPAAFAVTITDVDQNVPEGAEVSVDYEVTNTGDAEATQDISFTVDGTAEDTESGVTLDGGETFADTFVYATEQGDAPNVTVSVASENDTATETVSVNEDAIFAVTVVDVDEAVTAGETVTLHYEVTNTGDLEDTQNITVEVDGSVESTESGVTLGGGETFSRQFSYDTDGSDVPSVTVAVSSEDDTADRTVTVDEPSFFAVTITGVDSEVTEGETVTVDYEVTNTGDAEATQDITFEVDGGIESIESGVTLGGGEAFAGQFTYDTVAGDAPDVAVAVASDNETATETVSVLEPATAELSGLDIAGQDDNATVAVGTDANVTVTVTNTGDVASTFDVTLGIGSTVTETQTTTDLAGGESATVTFTNVTGGLSVGQYSVTVDTANDSRSGSLSVEEPAASTLAGLDIASAGETALIAGGDQGNVTVSLTNVGGQPDEFDLTLAIEAADGSLPVEETATVSVDPGATTQVTFEDVTAAVPTDLPSYTVTVSTADDTIGGNLTVWPDVTGDGNPATDTTGDDRLNNIDGDGDFDIFDVQELFKNFNDDVVQNIPAAFNFNDDADSKVTIFDVQALFNELAALP